MKDPDTDIVMLITVNQVVELESIHAGLSIRSCRLWKTWDLKILDVVRSTQPYVSGATDLDPELQEKWNRLVSKSEVPCQKAVLYEVYTSH